MLVNASCQESHQGLRRNCPYLIPFRDSYLHCIVVFVRTRKTLFQPICTPFPVPVLGPSLFRRPSEESISVAFPLSPALLSPGPLSIPPISVGAKPPSPAWILFFSVSTTAECPRFCLPFVRIRGPPFSSACTNPPFPGGRMSPHVPKMIVQGPGVIDQHACKMIPL